LRWLLTTGEPLSSSLARRYREEIGSTAVLANLYGQTETTGSVSLQAAIDDVTSHTVPIGRSLAGTVWAVVDDDGVPVAPGAIGELWVSGTSLAAGFLGRDDLTAERFVMSSMGGAPTRWYRTGDLVRAQADGVVVHHARRDFVVKIRGKRVELGEIESALAEHSSVEDVAVVVRTDASGDERLAAYIVVKRGLALSPRELRRHARQVLPDAATPSWFTLLPALPRLPSGKIDRRALPAPEPTSSVDSDAPDEVGDALEELVSNLWCELLELAPRQLTGDFFELGGDSIQAIQVVTRAQAALAIDAPLIDRFFDDPTVAGFARALRECLGDDVSALAGA
jgi:nonribosomal peptide synthetase DhbF